MYDTDDLVEAVLRHIAVLDATETPDADDATLVTRAYTAKWHELTAHGMEVTYWKLDEIPEAVFLVLRDLIALEVRGAFGMPLPAQQKEDEETLILRRLRRHVAVQSSGRATKASFM